MGGNTVESALKMRFRYECSILTICKADFTAHFGEFLTLNRPNIFFSWFYVIRIVVKMKIERLEIGGKTVESPSKVRFQYAYSIAYLGKSKFFFKLLIFFSEFLEPFWCVLTISLDLVLVGSTVESTFYECPEKRRKCRFWRLIWAGFCL